MSKIIINSDRKPYMDANGKVLTVDVQPTLQNKTISPATSQQVVSADTGYDGLSKVTVNAVTSTIDNNIAAGNIKSGVTILGITGNYSGEPVTLQEKTVTPTTSQQNVTPDTGYDGLSKVTVNATPLETKTVTPTAAQQTVSPSSGKIGLSSVTVNAAPLETKNITPTTSQQTINPSFGKIGMSSVTVNAVTNTIDSNIVAGNIKKNVTILGVKGTFEGSGGGDTYSIVPDTITWTHNTYITISLDIDAQGNLEVSKSAGSGTANNMVVCYPQSDTYNEDNIITQIDIPQAEGIYEMPITVWWDNQSGAHNDHNNHTISYTVVKGGGEGGKAVQYNSTYKSVSNTSLTASGLNLTVEKSGTYTIMWTAWRNTTSGTNSTRVYVAGTATGTDHTTWSDNYGQVCVETGIALTAGQTVEVYARARSTSYKVDVANLVIIQTA